MKNILIIILIFSSLNSIAQKRVLFVGIDGCRSDAMQIANTPNLDALIANGIYSPDALNTDVTSSGPGWSALLTGVWSEKHNVSSNNFDNNNYDEYPALLKYVNDFSPEMHTVSIVHWGPINDFIIDDDADIKFTFASDEDVTETAASYLSLNDPDFMFVHLDDVDHAGHSEGFSPNVPEYIDAIEIVDGQIGIIVQAIYDRPDYEQEDWLILVSTDHGGNGTSHGGASFGERNIFVIASGDSYDQAVIIAESEVVIGEVQNCLEETVELTFDGTNDYVEIAETPLFNFGATQDFTVECRIRTDNAADVSIVGDKDWATGFNPGFVFSFSGADWKVNIGDGNNRVDLNDCGEIADNEWHTLSVTFDRDGMMTAYTDGVFVESESIANIGNIDVDNGLFIGADIFSLFDYSGAIAEVRVWNGVVGATEINDWQCSFVDNSHPNYNDLLGYWKLNDQEDNSVEDFSGNNNNGTIIGATWESADTTIVFDFSNTPRSVDLSVTALNHLCIPIELAWDLDGQSLVEQDCSSSSVEESESILDFQIYPTITTDFLTIELSNSWSNDKTIIEIYSIYGQLVYSNIINQTTKIIDISSFSSGQYLLRVINGSSKKTSLIIRE